MSSIAQTQPRTGRRSFTLRAYLAGTAATAALLGAVVLVFASLGAYVAFNGLPIGGSSAAEPTSVKAAPAAPVAKRAHRQQAANGAAAQQNANAGGPASRAAGRDSSGGGARGDDAATAQTTAAPTSPAAPTGTSTAGVSAGATGTTPTAGAAPQSPSSGGGGSQLPTPQVTTPDSVSSTLGTVEQTLHSAGVDVPLSQAGSTVDQVTDGLVGGN